MTSIGANFGLPSASGWADLQNWQARMKTANKAFEADTSGVGDTLLGGTLTQSQGLNSLVVKQATARIQKQIVAAQAKTSTPANGGSGVYWGPNGNGNTSTSSAGSPRGTTSAVYWGVNLSV
jgi:hypothetical protein